MNVVVVDDHAGFRATACALLRDAGLTVVGEAADGAEAVAAVRRLRPDAVVLDVQLPDTDGFALASVLADEPAPPSVVLVSSWAAADYGDVVCLAPVQGFLTKSQLSGARLAAILCGARDG